jgi:hypothetical protein
MPRARFAEILRLLAENEVELIAALPMLRATLEELKRQT